MAEQTIRVKGLAELNRAFARMDADLKKDLTKTLKQAADPVRAKAEGLAVSNIRNIGSRWSRMRIGATGKAVYIAPKSKRRGGRPRPNLAGLLLDKAMLPALEGEESHVVASLDHMLAELAYRHGF